MLMGVLFILFFPILAVSYVSPYGPVSLPTMGTCVKAVLFCCVVAFIAGVIIRRESTHGAFLLRLFLLALLLRVAIGATIFVFNGQDFFGGDAWLYDFYGYQQFLTWAGDKAATREVNLFVGEGFGSAW